MVHIPVLYGVRWLTDGVFPTHGPAKFVPTAIVLAAVLVLSGLTHRLVELPGQTIGRRLVRVLDREFRSARP